jgi:asparagine synthase (glutamine-hydrolysing)
VPFLDNDLVEFAMKVPASLKLHNLLSTVQIDENLIGKKSEGLLAQHKEGKRLLRIAAGKFLPKVAASERKQGFSGPDASWFRGESIQYVKSKVFDPNSNLLQVFDKAKLRSLTEEHLSGKKNRRLLIWSLLNVEQTLGEFR